MGDRMLIEVETLQNVLDTQTMDDGNGNQIPRDMVTEAMGKMVSMDFQTYTAVIHDRIWADFRYRMIGSDDVDLWVQLLADKLDAVGMVYYVRMMALTGVDDLSDIGGTITRTYGSRTDSSENVSEDMPDTKTLLSSITYPSGKDHGEATKGEQTDYEHDSGSAAKHLSDMYDALRDPLDDMMRDLAPLWMDMW